jgi:hypothetical protein
MASGIGGYVLPNIRAPGAAELAEGGLACHVCSPKRGVAESGAKLIESVTGFEAELSDPHRCDREKVPTGFEEGYQLGELRFPVGPSDNLEDGRARRYGETRMAVEFAKRGRRPQIVEGNEKVDPAEMHFADDPLHLANRSKFEIDNSCVLEETLQERAPFGEPELADAAFRGMTRG